MNQARVVGTVSAAVLETLGEDGNCYHSGDIIYLGDSNVNHMKKRHLSTWLKYKDKLPDIISTPDYVGISDEDGSLEYVKVFSEHIKLVVRVAGDEKLYVRTMYTVLKSRTDYFIKSGRLKSLQSGRNSLQCDYGLLFEDGNRQP